MGGHFRATRHVEGCGVLARAQRDAELERSRKWGKGRRQHGYDALQVWGEAEWSRVPGSRRPRDHSCVRKAQVPLL